MRILKNFFEVNLAYGRVMEKCGFRETGSYCNLLYGGSIRPVKIMKLLAL